MSTTHVTKKKPLKKSSARKQTPVSKKKTPVSRTRKITKSEQLVNPYHLPTRPHIEQSAKHTTSPFVLSLKPIHEDAHIEESTQRVHVNLMMTPVTTPDLSKDLSLSPNELMDQLTEEVMSSHGWSRFSLPLPKVSPTNIHVQWTSDHKPQEHALAFDPSRITPFSHETFLPAQVPEDIFALFDFPEDEAAAEADLVDLEELQTEAESADAPRPFWKFKLPSSLYNLLSTTYSLSSWHRAVASFVAVSFLFVLPLHAMNVVQNLRETKTALEQQGAEAVNLLSDAAHAALKRESENAQSNFSLSSERFDSAAQTLQELGAGTRLLLTVLPLTQKSYKTGEALIAAGSELAIAGGRLSEGYSAIEQEVNPTPISRLNLLEAYVSSATPHLVSAQKALEQIDLSAIPTPYQSDVTLLTTTLPKLLSGIDEFQSFFSLAQQLLGAQGSKRYLIVFQNNTEIRPTGGFIGSFADVKVHDGVIEHMDVPGGGSYALQGALQENLMAPQPLQLLSARWEFQDANWFPDFPTSARQLIQFYQDAGGGSVDGVLAVNATFVADLIGLLGPIEMPEYGRTITQENFIFEAQRIVEMEYDRVENTPKAFIGDLAPKLVDRAIEKTSEDFLASLDFLKAGLAQKDLQLYLESEDLQREVLTRGWGGEVKQTDGDYLMVVDTNLGGGKTDGVIQEQVDLAVNVQKDGSIVNTATISRTHFGLQGLLFTGVNNVDYLRVYVPKGSELLNAEGFSPPDISLFNPPLEDWTLDDDLTYSVLTQSVDPDSGTTVMEEQGKTVFGNWVQTSPGSTSKVTFSYKLPFTIQALAQSAGLIASVKSLVGLPQTHEYTLTVQKQSGVIDRTTTVHVTTPEDMNVLWSSEGTDIDNDTDQLFAALLETL
ncbi:DUF4012 domain-containing protein [Candidatus Uhrbacteria bacterium]|nr:DUF4012 domain-containing protein [Candidatus Uhrbacteria bacterium]